ncbi:HNH endonuclease [Shewanella frigidimarina]|uniref:HNH endonuclease n=1 Tax=Shewanella frigidimarina TaxID=56812 RepID=UPI000F4FCE94|nr:HNH endonuclease signature motif containing protein [Shewanella frigidimarina]RPA62050.1 HNH endonuclease [Shewanella frigidimarina]
MKTMVAPSAVVTYSQRHKNVVSSKANTVKGNPNTTKTNLLLLEPQILARYSLFEQAIVQNTLFSFPEDPALAAHKDDLLSCYKGRTKKVKEIFKLIEDTQPTRFLKRCPYCGVTLPKTYDHYLPEAHFPELSVHALNLVPCCGSCNSTKNNFWKNNTHRTFLYFYKDIIPNVQYINVNIVTGAGSIGAQFSIQRPINIQNALWEVLLSHYEKLGLIFTYNELASDEITELFNSCVAHIRCGGANVRLFVENLLATEETLYGINHWRVVLMKSLAINAYFSRIVNANV